MSVGRTQEKPGAIQRSPALPAAVALAGGVLVSGVLPPAPGLWVATVATICALMLLLRGRSELLRSLIALVALATGGIALAQVQRYCYPRNHISALATDTPRLAQLELSIDYPPRTLTWPFGQYRALPPKQVMTASVRSVKTWTGWVDCGGDVLVQIAQPHPRIEQGQRIRVLGMLERPGPAMNPGQFNWAGYYRDQRILASVQVHEAGNIEILRESSIGAVPWLREQVRRALARGFPLNRSLDHALLRALVLGDNDPELRDVQEQFRRTGTSHHLAISGMHVAVLGGVVLGICRLLRLGPRTSLWAGLISVVGYGVVALPSPPVVRSVILSACFALGMLGGRRAGALQLLALSAVFMLIYHPLDLFNAGFQLSFGTVLGLILFTPLVLSFFPAPDPDVAVASSFRRPDRLTLLMNWLKRSTRTTLAAGIVAWVVSMPLIAFHFEQLNPWAILASIALAPVVFLSLIGGLAKIVLTLLWPSGASAWAALAAGPVAGMRHMVDWLATFPGAEVPLPAPPVWVVLLFYLLLLTLLIPWPRRWLSVSLRIAALAGCVLLAVVSVRVGFASVRAHAGDLQVTLLAVGAGQCAVIEPPGADAVVIDAGSMTLSDVWRKVFGPFLRHQGRRDVASIFISHANSDHFSAVADIVSAYDVKRVFVARQFARQSVDNPSAQALLRTLDAMDRPPRHVFAGRSYDLGGGATLDILWPPADLNADANDTSLVARLMFGGRKILFTGDIQNLAERALSAAPGQIRADVLVAPHHGSFESATIDFVDAVAPDLIVCSNDRTLSAKQKDFDRAMRNRRVLRTHLAGGVTIRVSSGGELTVKPYIDE